MFFVYEFYAFLSSLNKMNQGDIYDGLMVDIDVWRIIIKRLILYLIMAFSNYLSHVSNISPSLFFNCIKISFPQ